MQSLRKTVENGFHSYGLFASKHPWYMILLSGFLVLSICYPMLNLPLPGNEPSMFYSNAQHSSPVNGAQKGNFEQDDTPTWLLESEPTAYVQQLVIKSTVRPWPGDEGGQKEAFRSAVSSVFPLLQVLQDFTYNGSSVFEDCYYFSNNVIKANKKLKFLFPNNGCLVVSPALFWEGKESMFQIDKDVKTTIRQYSGKSTLHPNTPSVEDLLFGIPSRYNGVKSFNSKGSDHVISYAVTLVLKRHDPHLLRALQNHLWEEYGSPLLSSYAQRCWDKQGVQVCQNASEIVTHIYLKGQLKISDLYLLFPMYVLTGFYIYFSVKQIHFLKSKFGMAFSAVFSIMASLVTSVGLSVHFGLKPTLISSKVYPFFGALYCLHNILIITNSIVASSSHEEVEERVAAGLRREAFSLFKNLFYEGLFVVIGVWIGSPEIKEISGFAGVAILSVFLLHMVFFVPVLSIDIRRRVDFAEETYSATIRFSSRKSNARAKKEFEYERRLLANENGGIQDTGIFSKRLRFLSFMVNYRVLKMTVLIAITALIFLSNNENKIYETPKLRTYEIHKHDQFVGSDNVFSDIVFNVNDLTSSESLSFKHWPTLFAYYNVSLENRHISILPPILVPIVSKLDLNKINSDSSDKIEKSHELIAPLVLNNNQHLDFVRYEMDTRFKYYMTLGTGAFVGICMCMLFVMFYKCICTRNYGNWSKGYRRCHSEETYSSAAGGCVPLALSGHTCAIDVVSVDGVSVASCDLAGELRVWDTHSGECTCTISRKYTQISPNQVEAKNELSVKQHFRKRSLDSSIMNTYQRASVWSLLIKEQLVFAGCENGSIEIWDSVTGMMKGWHDLRKAGVVHLACEDTRLVCARVNGTLDFFDLTVPEFFADSQLQYRGHDRSRANGFTYPLKNICNYESLQLIQKHNIRSAHQQPITALKIAQNRVFTGSSDHTLRMFNVMNGACEQTFFGHSGAITVIHVDTSEPFGVMSGASDGSLCVWNLHSGNYSLNMTKHTAAISKVCSTRWHIVSTAQDDSICVWSRKSGKLLRTVPMEQGCSNALCLLSNNWCVSGGLGKILLWDMRNGNVTRTIQVGSGTLALPCVQQIMSLGNLSILCVVGRELYVVRLPAVLEKNDH